MARGTLLLGVKMGTRLDFWTFAAIFSAASMAGVVASSVNAKWHQDDETYLEAARFRGSVPQGTISCSQHAILEEVIVCSGGGGVCGPADPCDGTCASPCNGACNAVISFIPNGAGGVYIAKRDCGITVAGGVISTYNTYKCNLPILDECYCNETPANQCGGPFRCTFLPYWTCCGP